MKLSIIVPVYNSANYLTKSFEQLKSVYDRINEDEFEIIFVNDGSTDDSGILLEDMKLKRKNIKVIHQENQGSSGARNSGIDIAQGEYIQFLDSDDYIDWEIVSDLLDIAINKNIDAFSYRIGFVDENGNHVGNMKKHPVPYSQILSGPEALIHNFMPSSICCWLFKSKFLNDNNLRITPKITHMDVEFTVRMLIFANQVYFHDSIAYYYVSRKGSITKPTNQQKLESFLYDEVIVANLIRNNIKSNTCSKLKSALERNYNTVVWNLLWYFVRNKNSVSTMFKSKCLSDLKELKLYPIRGELKTPFQKISSIVFNQYSLFKILIK